MPVDVRNDDHLASNTEPIKNMESEGPNILSLNCSEEPVSLDHESYQVPTQVSIYIIACVCVQNKTIN